MVPVIDSKIGVGISAIVCRPRERMLLFLIIVLFEWRRRDGGMVSRFSC